MGDVADVLDEVDKVEVPSEGKDPRDAANVRGHGHQPLRS
jgi:hypothetical protein